MISVADMASDLSQLCADVLKELVRDGSIIHDKVNDTYKLRKGRWV